MKALAALESVVRTGSVSAAADDLGVTHGAVSKQIALLEEWFGRPLFSEKRRGMVANAIGVKLAEAMGQACDILDAALEEIDTPAASLVQVVAPATWAMRWLMPRLPEFHSANPDLKIRVRPTHTPEDWDSLEFDVIIRRLAPLAARLKPRPLMAETLGLVAAPSLIAEGVKPANIHFIEAETRVGELTAWLRTAGRRSQPREPMRFPHFYIALEAALSGKGALVAPLELVSELISRAALVEPWPNWRIPGASYSIGFNRSSLVADASERFTNWLIETARDGEPGSQSGSGAHDAAFEKPEGSQNLWL